MRLEMGFERIVWGIGAAAGLGLAVTGGHGYAAAPDGAEGFRLHLALALGCGIAALFSHLWVALFLLGTRRGLARWRGEAGGAARGGLARRRRGAWIAAAVAVAAALALVWSGAAAYAGSPGAGLHAALFWTALAAQGAALAVEWRALRANAAELARLLAAA